MRPVGQTLYPNYAGRPPGGFDQTSTRAAALPFPVRWIPACLGLLLSLVTLWSWRVLQPAFANMLRLQAPQKDERMESDSHLTPVDPANIPSAPTSTLFPGFTPEVRRWSAEIIHWASQYDLDPNLVAVVMQIESCGWPTARSNAGAMGLFQVMPFHFQLHEDPYNPQTNAKRGLTYLARGLELAGGRIDLALAGYNGGHSVIFKDSSEWPAETRRYVSWGMGILDDLVSGARQMPTLLAWLEAGGDGLCRQAARAQSE
jgi:hypothetical protein